MNGKKQDFQKNTLKQPSILKPYVGVETSFLAWDVGTVVAGRFRVPACRYVVSLLVTTLSKSCSFQLFRAVRVGTEQVLECEGSEKSALVLLLKLSCWPNHK